jgi:hypothetical protein
LTQIMRWPLQFLFFILQVGGFKIIGFEIKSLPKCGILMWEPFQMI